jgi:hypothetical protein
MKPFDRGVQSKKLGQLQLGIQLSTRFVHCVLYERAPGKYSGNDVVSRNFSTLSYEFELNSTKSDQLLIRGEIIIPYWLLSIVGLARLSVSFPDDETVSI